MPDSNTEDTQNTWKKHGLEMEFQIEPIEKNIKIAYKIQLTDRQSRTGLVGSQIQSTTIMPTNQETLVAKIPFHGEHFDKQESFLLSKIPIIGPLFSEVGEQTLNRTLSIVFKVIKKSTVSK